MDQNAENKSNSCTEKTEPHPDNAQRFYLLQASFPNWELHLEDTFQLWERLAA